MAKDMANALIHIVSIYLFSMQPNITIQADIVSQLN